jgi:hypothetical protein
MNCRRHLSTRILTSVFQFELEDRCEAVRTGWNEYKILLDWWRNMFIYVDYRMFNGWCVWRPWNIVLLIWNDDFSSKLDFRIFWVKHSFDDRPECIDCVVFAFEFIFKSSASVFECLPRVMTMVMMTWTSIIHVLLLLFPLPFSLSFALDFVCVYVLFRFIWSTKSGEGKCKKIFSASTKWEREKARLNERTRERERMKSEGKL